MSIQVIMHYLCEIYFYAIKRWMTHDEDTFKNRISVMNHIVSIIRSNDVMSVLKFEVNNIPLLPEVIPAAGVHYQPKHDILAYEQAKTILQDPEFEIAGIYFQNILSKALLQAQVHLPNPSDPQKCVDFNFETLKLLFRVQQDAGHVHLATGLQEFQDQTVPELSGDSLLLFQYLTQQRPYLREKVVEVIVEDTVAMNVNDGTGTDNGDDIQYDHDENNNNAENTDDDHDNPNDDDEDGQSSVASVGSCGTVIDPYVARILNQEHHHN